jgi:hypothetical protein
MFFLLYEMPYANPREIAFEIYVTPCGVLLHESPVYSIIISAILAFKSRRDERIIAIDVFIR